MLFSRILLISLFVPGKVVAQHHQDGLPTTKSHGRNWARTSTIAIAPLQMSEEGFGTCISFEHALVPTGYVSIYIPAMITFNLSNEDPNGHSGSGSNIRNENMQLYAMPGLKFYPTGMGRVKYAIGPSLAFGKGKIFAADAVRDTIYGPAPIVYSHAGTYKLYDHFTIGMIANNSLNFNPKKHLYIGLELGMGVTVFSRANGGSHSGELIFQSSFKIGYTF